MSGLPDGWALTNLRQICEFKYGKALPSPLRDGVGFPVFGSNGVVGAHSQPLCNGPAIVIGRKGSVGVVHYSAAPCSPIDTTYFIDSFGPCLPRFLMHRLRAMPLADLNRATAIPGLNREDAYGLDLELPPLPEQQRIADKLDAILARVDACLDRLDRVGPLLQRFRQSVLARAVSGGVGDQQYDISEWTPCAIGQLGVVVTGNTPARVRASDPTGRIPLFKPTDLSQGDAVCQSDERLTDEGVSGARLLPTGAVLVTCIGATIGKTGLAAVPCATNQQINAVVCDESRVDPRYLYLWFSSPIGQQAVIGNASATTLPIINKSKFASLQVLLPPLAVQRDIAGRVSMLLEQAGRLQRRLDGAAATIHRLAPATLAKAFRGELVPQDPNDEPAAEMLARLSSSTPPKQTARRGRSTA